MSLKIKTSKIMLIISLFNRRRTDVNKFLKNTMQKILNKNSVF